MGNLVCGTGAAFIRLRSNASSILKLHSRLRFALVWLHPWSCLPGWPTQFYCDLQGRDWRSQWNCVKVTLVRMGFVPQRRVLFQHLSFQNLSAHVMFLPFSHRNLLRATAAHTFSTSQLPKAVRTCGAFGILTSTCASRHSDVHISTSKSAPNMVCPVRFDCQICFAPHRRALFHLSSPQMPLHLPL